MNRLRSFAALEKLLSKKDLAKLRQGSEGDTARYHHGLGTGLRNAWGLWGGSPLARHFNALGIRHPDDMSGIIFTSFWRHLNGKPIELEKQVAHYKRYCDVRQSPAPRLCSDGTQAKALFLLEDRSPGRDRVIHAFACDAQQAFLVWELDQGWYTPDVKLQARISTLRREHPGLISAPLVGE